MTAAAAAPRLVVVLGYSGWRSGELHNVCAARLRLAESEARAEDIVLLSGWSRRRSRAGEAELMARAWNGRSARVLLDRGARTTLSNAVGAATVAAEHGASEVVLVTSGWHGRRAGTLLAAALEGSKVEIGVVGTHDRGSTVERLREAVCWTIVPFQRRVAASRARSRRPQSESARVEAA